jgi:hypothetical protein
MVLEFYLQKAGSAVALAGRFKFLCPRIMTPNMVPTAFQITS